MEDVSNLRPIEGKKKPKIPKIHSFTCEKFEEGKAPEGIRSSGKVTVKIKDLIAEAADENGIDIEKVESVIVFKDRKGNYLIQIKQNGGYVEVIKEG